MATVNLRSGLHLLSISVIRIHEVPCCSIRLSKRSSSSRFQNTMDNSGVATKGDVGENMEGDMIRLESDLVDPLMVDPTGTPKSNFEVGFETRGWVDPKV